jgi:hypothetical protein
MPGMANGSLIDWLVGVAVETSPVSSMVSVMSKL